jgi:hypothetical protein
MKHANFVPVDMVTKPQISKTAAIKWAGSQALLADRLGVTPSAVSQWSEDLPEGRVWQLIVLGCPQSADSTAELGSSGDPADSRLAATDPNG